MPFSGVQTCALDRKSTRLNSSHGSISYAVFCLQKKQKRLNTNPASRPDAVRLAALTRPHRNAGTLTSPRQPTRVFVSRGLLLVFFFFFNDTATTEIYTLSLHDALPI